jgi:hypothetical protein
VAWKGRWKETKAMNSQGNLSQYILWETKKLEILEYFKYFGSIITNDAGCTREIKSSIAMATRHSTRRRLFSPAKWN